MHPAYLIAVDALRLWDESTGTEERRKQGRPPARSALDDLWALDPPCPRSREVIVPLAVRRTGNDINEQACMYYGLQKY